MRGREKVGAKNRRTQESIQKPDNESRKIYKNLTERQEKTPNKQPETREINSKLTKQ